MKLQLQSLQKEKYSENRNGEGNWWSAAIQKLFDNITDKFDPFKNKKNRHGIGTYKELEEQSGDMKLAPH